MLVAVQVYEGEIEYINPAEIGKVFRLCTAEAGADQVWQVRFLDGSEMEVVDDGTGVLERLGAGAKPDSDSQCSREELTWRRLFVDNDRLITALVKIATQPEVSQQAEAANCASDAVDDDIIRLLAEIDAANKRTDDMISERDRAIEQARERCELWMDAHAKQSAAEEQAESMRDLAGVALGRQGAAEVQATIYLEALTRVVCIAVGVLDVKALAKTHPDELGYHTNAIRKATALILAAEATDTEGGE